MLDLLAFLIVLTLITLFFIFQWSSPSFGFTLDGNGKYILSKSEMTQLFKDDQKKDNEIQALKQQIEIYKNQDLNKLYEKTFADQNEVIKSLRLEIETLKALNANYSEQILVNETLKSKYQYESYKGKFLGYTGWTAAIIAGIAYAVK